MGKQYVIPNPIIDKRENKQQELLIERYNKLVEPGKVAKAGKKVGQKATAMLPAPVKNAGKNAKQAIAEAEFFKQCMKVAADGFSILEKHAAKLTVSEKSIVRKIDKTTEENSITSLDEICLARSYSISKIVNRYRLKDLVTALLEGGATGAFGLAGLPANLVASTFIFYRATQSVAMMYGYDVKHNPSELVIAGEVFMSALNPSHKGASEISSLIGKIMVMTETTLVRQSVKKTWEEMAREGGVRLLIVQMRALANNAAKKALERAGEKGLEESMFKSIFEAIGKKLSKDVVGKATPAIGGVIGALFDIAVMNQILEYADVFYEKRFIVEKAARIVDLVDCNTVSNYKIEEQE